MKVYAVSGIIGDGTFDDATGVDNSFRPAVADYPANWVIAISVDHATNPNKNWALCVVATTQATLDVMSADSRIFVLPFGPAQLDQPWTSVGTRQQRQTWASRITQRTGVQVTRDDARSVREIINAVGLAVDPNFTASNLDVME